MARRHRQGPHFGLGAAQGRVDPAAAWLCLGLCLALVALGLLADGW